MNKKQQHSLVFLRNNDREMLKQLYIWQISEDKKDMMSCTFSPPTQEYKEENFEKYYNDMKSRLTHYTFLQNNETKELLGFLSYQKINMRNFSIELSYYFPKENRGRGYGTELMSLFLDTMFNFEKMNLNKVYAETYEGNVRSKKLLEHFGFKIDGVMREHYWFDGGKVKYDQLIFSLLRSEWEKYLIDT
ncbi:MAG: GNAT family N-acetyltransferase [Candidatus Cloacimonetes bacterium]|nr:GNAT family N-acetyltransferase [Candidatus Cloacimonadota bacterium]